MSLGLKVAARNESVIYMVHVKKNTILQESRSGGRIYHVPQPLMS